MKDILSENVVEPVLQSLDRLTQEEARNSSDARGHLQPCLSYDGGHEWWENTFGFQTIISWAEFALDLLHTDYAYRISIRLE